MREGDVRGPEFKLTTVGCARCHGEGHEDLLFKAFTHPPVHGDKTEDPLYSHFAICPTTNEPILFRTVPMQTGVIK